MSDAEGRPAGTEEQLCMVLFKNEGHQKPGELAIDRVVVTYSPTGKLLR